MKSDRAEELRGKGVDRADSNAPWCDNPACTLCSTADALCLGVPGEFRTECGTKIRRPDEPMTFTDVDGRVYRRSPVIFTFDVARATCVQCLVEWVLRTKKETSP